MDKYFREIKILNSLKYIYVVIFMIISVAPLCLFGFTYSASTGDGDNIDKKTEAQFPKIINADGVNLSFDDDCEEWLNRNLPLRKYVISNSNVLLGEVLRTPTSNVVIGSDGWIYSTETLDEYMDTKPFSPEQIQNIAITLGLIQERIEADGGRFLFVPVPDKCSIYPEYMPNRYLKADDNNLFRIYRELEKKGINYLDLRYELLGYKQDSSLGRLYYKRDTHWTALGAIVGYNAMMSELGRTPCECDLYAYTSRFDRRGDLEKMLFPALNRTEEEYLPEFSLDYNSFEFTYPAGVTDTQSQLENYMSDREDHDNNFTAKKQITKDGSSLYMIRDSFARALLPYMIASYDEATFVRTLSPSVENAALCNDVIYEICERNLGNLVAATPYMYAPRRDEYNFSPEEYESDNNSCYVDDEGYAVKIYGAIDNQMRDPDGRIMVKLCDDSYICVFEAFPIAADTTPSKSHSTGFSLYIDKSQLKPGEYRVTILSGDYESKTDACVVINNPEENEDATGKDENSTNTSEVDNSNKAETSTNPYEEENAPHKIVYRGSSIAIGDNIRDIADDLGRQAAPSETVNSCLSGEEAMLFYYPDITLETDMQGNIYYISLMDNSYSDGKERAATASGITIGSNRADIQEKLGKPDKENNKNCLYRTEHLKISYTYKDEKVTSVILEDGKYSNGADESAFEEEIPGAEYDNGNTYLYDDAHQMQTGWQIIDGEYYFFDRLTGERIVGQSVDGIKIGDDGAVILTEYEKKKIETMMKAHQIVLENTNPNDTMEEKRKKVFDWVLSFPYHRYRHIRDVYTQEGIEIIEANDIFDEGAGDCVSESAALAFLFHEIGYNNVYWVHDTGHSWVRSDDRMFDPLFAESKSYEANYDAPFTDYRASMAHSMLIY